MVLRKRRRPSTGTVLGGLALFIALGGTALAATGTLVNIADPVNASNLARVDANGQLKTTSVDVAPAKPFSIHQNLFENASNIIIPTTNATLALDRIVIAPWNSATARRTVFLYLVGRPTGASCDINGPFRIVGVWEFGPGDTVIDEPTTPMMLRPLAGNPAWCLIAQSYAAGNSDSTFSYITLSGYIAGGALPAGVGVSRSAKGPEFQDGQPRP